MSFETIPLDLPMKLLGDFFTCPVCMCTLRSTHVTPCGHRYCEECITESISRHHKCPCCNAGLNQDSLIRDHQYDELLMSLIAEKEKSESTYFENLIKSANGQNEHSSDSTAERKFSPIENVMKKHLRQGLKAHEQYYKELNAACLSQEDKLENRCCALVSDLAGQGYHDSEVADLSAKYRADCEQQKETLRDERDRCSQLVVGAYDKYLEDRLPQLSILPVTVSVHLLAKNMSLPDLTLRPHDRLEVIHHHIKESMEKRGDRVIKYGPGHALVCFGPFSKRSRYEMHQLASNLVELGATHPDIFILPEGSIPVLQLNVKAGSEIAVYGMVQCESDLPKQCFISTFNPATAHKADYFSCRDCGFNWICRACIEVCHKDHTTTPYILNHQPTWACCYCRKKNTCLIQDQDT